MTLLHKYRFRLFLLPSMYFSQAKGHFATRISLKVSLRIAEKEKNKSYPLKHSSRWLGCTPVPTGFLLQNETGGAGDPEFFCVLFKVDFIAPAREWVVLAEKD